LEKSIFHIELYKIKQCHVVQVFSLLSLLSFELSLCNIPPQVGGTKTMHLIVLCLRDKVTRDVTKETTMHGGRVGKVGVIVYDQVFDS